MKKNVFFLSVVVLALSTFFITSCDNDDDGGPEEIPPALIKSLSIAADGSVTTWEFTYDTEDRLTSVAIDEDGFLFSITYDYSVANRLTETEVIEPGVEEYETVFVVDVEGRIIKQLWDPLEADDNFDGYEYDANGYLVRTYYKEDGVEVTQETATIADENITVHSRLDGSTVERTKTFTYLPNATALNVSNLPQANLRNSERRTVSGLYGKGSKKLVDFLELEYPEFPDDYVKNSNTYTFDDENRVLTITRTGVDVDGNDTGLNEVFTYTYYEEVQ